ncbi:MAG: hypothetical protein IPK72_12615 [Candidatus Eisenbacteria bacterium]|nr:hypothetical protein [Candidatus Eisenbacteria bacterium]
MQQNRLRRTIFGIALAVGCIVADPLPQVRPGAGSDLASAWTCGPSSASASELQADWNGQFVHLFLPGTFTEYSIWRADGGSAEFRMLDYSQVGCTEACVYDDLGLQFGESFDYQIKVLLPDGTVATFGPVNVQIDPTRGRSLDSRMAPNPAVGPTSLRFQIPATLAGREEIPVLVSFHDIAGRELRRFDLGGKGVGVHVFPWDGTDVEGQPLPTGTYFYRVRAGATTEVGRLTLLR